MTLSVWNDSIVSWGKKGSVTYPCCTVIFPAASLSNRIVGGSLDDVYVLGPVTIKKAHILIEEDYYPQLIKQNPELEKYNTIIKVPKEADILNYSNEYLDREFSERTIVEEAVENMKVPWSLFLTLRHFQSMPGDFLQNYDPKISALENMKKLQPIDSSVKPNQVTLTLITGGNGSSTFGDQYYQCHFSDDGSLIQLPYSFACNVVPYSMLQRTKVNGVPMKGSNFFSHWAPHHRGRIHSRSMEMEFERLFYLYPVGIFDDFVPAINKECPPGNILSNENNALIFKDNFMGEDYKLKYTDIGLHFKYLVSNLFICEWGYQERFKADEQVLEWFNKWFKQWKFQIIVRAMPLLLELHANTHHRAFVTLTDANGKSAYDTALDLVAAVYDCIDGVKEKSQLNSAETHFYTFCEEFSQKWFSLAQNDGVLQEYDLINDLLLNNEFNQQLMQLRKNVIAMMNYCVGDAKTSLLDNVIGRNLTREEEENDEKAEIQEERGQKIITYFKTIGDVAIEEEKTQAPFIEPLLKRPSILSVGTILLQRRKDGKPLVLIRKVADGVPGEINTGFGGYVYSVFSKGQFNEQDDLTLQQTALKETREETGFLAEIIGFLGDFQGGSGYTHIYTAGIKGGHPAEIGWESASVHWVTLEEALKLVEKYNLSKRDTEVIRHLIQLENSNWPSDISKLTTCKQSLNGRGNALLLDPQTKLRYVKKSVGTYQLGKEYGVIRTPPAQIIEEHITDNAYRALSISVPERKLLFEQGQPILLGKYLESAVPFDPTRLQSPTAHEDLLLQQQIKMIRRQFAADALLFNYDLVSGYGNILFGLRGEIYRIDNGGALRRRSLGSLKPDFNEFPLALWTMRDKNYFFNHAVYGDLTIYEIADQILVLNEKRDEFLAVLPITLQEVMKRRLNNMVEVANKAKIMQQQDKPVRQANIELYNFVNLQALKNQNQQVYFWPTEDELLQYTTQQITLPGRGNSIVVDPVSGMRYVKRETTEVEIEHGKKVRVRSCPKITCVSLVI